VLAKDPLLQPERDDAPPQNARALDSQSWHLFMIRFAAPGIIVAALLLACRGQSQNDYEAASLCRANYRKAHTATDTSIVDAQTPISSRGHASAAMNCGTMRKVDWTR
jgi:hypothetical protein